MASNPYPLGIVNVTSAGTRERLTKGLSSPTEALRCQKIFIRARAGNTGDVTVGDVSVVAATGAGAYVVLDAGESHEFSVENAPAGLDASQFYLDVGTSGDGVIAYITFQ